MTPGKAGGLLGERPEGAMKPGAAPGGWAIAPATDSALSSDPGWVWRDHEPPGRRLPSLQGWIHGVSRRSHPGPHSRNAPLRTQTVFSGRPPQRSNLKSPRATPGVYPSGLYENLHKSSLMMIPWAHKMQEDWGCTHVFSRGAGADAHRRHARRGCRRESPGRWPRAWGLIDARGDAGQAFCRRQRLGDRMVLSASLCTRALTRRVRHGGM